MVDRAGARRAGRGRAGAVAGRAVAVVVAVAVAVTGCGVGGGSGPAAADRPSAPRPGGEDASPSQGPPAVPRAVEPTAGDFLDVNGWQWFYTTAEGIRFTEITDRLDELRAAGTRVIGIYAPYHGDPGKWLGSMPLDFYATAPTSGTLDDFTALVDAAHDRGMLVVAYAGPLTIDRESEFFRAAEAQYAADDRDSPQARAVRWAADDTDPLPEPAPGPSEWRYSQAAGAYYWSLWGEVGFDLELPAARAEVARFVEFWLDTGLDGFMWDSGVPHPELREVLVDLPLARRDRGAWLTFEVTSAEEADTYVAYGLTSWFNLEDNDEENDYSIVVDGPATPDHLAEAMLVAQEAREDGRLTHAWSPWEPDEYPDERMLVQEAAVLTGLGIAYGAASYTNRLEWSPAVRTGWEQVLATVNAHPALRPSATRERVPATTPQAAYALTSTAEDGSQTVLLVANLSGEPATVTLDLAGAGVLVGQAPLDLLAAEPAPPISGTSYDVDLPAWGTAILQLDTAPAG